MPGYSRSSPAQGPAAVRRDAGTAIPSMKMSPASCRRGTAARRTPRRALPQARGPPPTGPPGSPDRWRQPADPSVIPARRADRCRRLHVAVVGTVNCRHLRLHRADPCHPPWLPRPCLDARPAGPVQPDADLLDSIRPHILQIEVRPGFAVPVGRRLARTFFAWCVDGTGPGRDGVDAGDVGR